MFSIQPTLLKDVLDNVCTIFTKTLECFTYLLQGELPIRAKEPIDTCKKDDKEREKRKVRRLGESFKRYTMLVRNLALSNFTIYFTPGLAGVVVV
jgi:hypothetical protein